MKKLVITVAVLSCAASVVAQIVTSANTVGYSKQNAGAGAFIMAAPQFVGTSTTSTTIGEAFGDNLPSGSEIYVWTGSGYAIYTYFGSWFDEFFAPADGVVIDRGDGVWVKNTGGTAVEFLFSGEVPENGSTTNAIASGFNMVANPYPTKMTLGAIAGANSGDEVYIWTGSGYAIYTYFGSWFDEFFAPADNVEVAVGGAFWYNTTTPRSWTATKPY